MITKKGVYPGWTPRNETTGVEAKVISVWLDEAEAWLAMFTFMFLTFPLTLEPEDEVPIHPGTVRVVLQPGNLQKSDYKI